MDKRVLIALLMFAVVAPLKSQVLISLIFGEALNSEKIEFGLDGGVNFSNLSGYDQSKFNNTFNLGFYFDIKKNEHWMLHTGVIVKSTLGATELPTYSINDADNDPDLDGVYQNGDVTKKINYFNVPICLKYRFAKLFHVEAGPMLGLRYGAKDYFYADDINDGDLTYSTDVDNTIKRIDAGILVGTGMKLSKVSKSAQVGVRYYFGMTDIIKDNPGDAVKNSSLYVFFSLPIGAQPKEHKDKK